MKDRARERQLDLLRNNYRVFMRRSNNPDYAEHEQDAAFAEAEDTLKRIKEMENEMQTKQ